MIVIPIIIPFIIVVTLMTMMPNHDPSHNFHQDNDDDVWDHDQQSYAFSSQSSSSSQ